MACLAHDGLRTAQLMARWRRAGRDRDQELEICRFNLLTSLFLRLCLCCEPLPNLPPSPADVALSREHTAVDILAVDSAVG